MASLESLQAEALATWHLDGDWSDATGGFSLVAAAGANISGFQAAAHAMPSGKAYGPTGSTLLQGASSTNLSHVNTTAGFTMAGWCAGVNGGSGGRLFGFGTTAWGEASLVLYNSWGFLWITGGKAADRATIKFDRPFFDGCWHHVALVLPPRWREGVPFSVFLDGVLATGIADRLPADFVGAGPPAFTNSQLFGSAFGIGGNGDGKQRIDEVSLWARALSSAEVALLATPTGPEPACKVSASPPPPPSASRCVHPELNSSHAPQPPSVSLHVRFLTSRYVTVVTDPTEYLHAQIHARCGDALASIDAAYLTSDPYNWRINYEYKYAAMEVVDLLRPPILEAVSRQDHLHLSREDGGSVGIERVSVWPNAAREMRVSRPAGAPGRAHEYVATAEVQFFSFLELTRPLSSDDGSAIVLLDSWGHNTTVVFNDRTTVSWALKVDQAGYLPTAAKFAYFGSWLGPGGPLNVTQFEGSQFSVWRIEDGNAIPGGTGNIAFDSAEGGLGGGAAVRAFEGVASRRVRDSEFEGVPLYGEDVLELDFSDLTEPGSYFVQIDGVGRSWSFVIGQEALGLSFYNSARGLYHQRCGTNLTAPYTAWARDDVHATYRGGQPPQDEDYKDHTADGWGFSDESGAFVQLSWFEVVRLRATNEALPQVSGGWHDAADFDRRDFHFLVVANLVNAFLLFPDHFSEGQLQIPNSGDGVPDILIEAMWGVDVWRRAQEADGRVATWIEADSHPHEKDTAQDQQPYFLGLATRQSTLHYAAHAALLARGYQRAGADTSPGSTVATLLESAQRAFAFGARRDADARVGFNLTLDDGRNISWREPAQPAPEYLLHAALQLWLATNNTYYREFLESSELEAAMQRIVNNANWQPGPLLNILVSVAAADPLTLPAGWHAAANAKILEQADLYVERQLADAYRKVWYDTDHGYFKLGAWGNNGFLHIRWLVAAYGLHGDSRFRDAAAVGVNWMQGANPLGRPFTTGIGSTQLSALLHNPSMADDIDEPVPGITIYGIYGAVGYHGATRVWGLFEGKRNDGYAGSTLAQMPPPWNNSELADLDSVRGQLQAFIPYWRRLQLLEAQNVPQTEFTVAETIGHAVFVLGGLLGPGWTPAVNMSMRAPKTRDQLLDGWMLQP